MSQGPDVVFLGPSLSHDEAREILPEALLLPPAQMGDVLTAVSHYQPHSISIVDGTFRSTMSVFHKEILYAIDQGVWVLGASSMGALRAAECDRFGMIGVGQIYDQLRSGEITDDDEVALTHADSSQGFRALTDAFVTIRATLGALVEEGALSEQEAQELTRLQKERWFPDRHLADTVIDAKQIGVDAARLEQIKVCLRTHNHDPKREDAIALLERVKQLPPGPVPEQDRPGVVYSGQFQATLARDILTSTQNGVDLSFDDIRTYAMLNVEDYEAVMQRVRENTALFNLGLMIGGLPTVEEGQQAREEIAGILGVPVDELDARAAELDLDGRNLDQMVGRWALRKRAANSWLGRVQMGAVTAPFLDELRLTGRYEDIKFAAALQMETAQSVDFSPPPSRDSVVYTLCALRGWTWCDWNEWVLDHDLDSTDQLVFAAELAIKADHAVFGTGVIPHPADAPEMGDEEPMMSRGR